MRKYRIVIVDDHLLFSNSLKKLIEGFADFEVVKQMCNGKDFVDYISNESNPPDLFIGCYDASHGWEIHHGMDIKPSAFAKSLGPFYG
jgi:DNA-binding NarL/FixJ family response regulator